MSFYYSSPINKNEFNLSLSDALIKHRSISLTTKKGISGISPSPNGNMSTLIKDNSKFHNIKAFSHKTKNVSGTFATLPKVSIDLNESSNLKEEEVNELKMKLKELTIDKIKLINKNYIKELKTLREAIENVINNNNML